MYKAGNRIPGSVRLAKLLAHLKASPKLSLSGLKRLKLSYAFNNDHFGARHFAKQNLPKIRFDNPNLIIEVERARKKEDEHWRPEMELEFVDGKTTTLNLHDKWSSTILKELMNIAGGDPWKKYVAESTAAGLPAIFGEAFHSEDMKPEVKRQAKDKEPLPSLKEYREKNPPTEKPSVDKSHTPKPKSSSSP